MMTNVPLWFTGMVFVLLYVAIVLEDWLQWNRALLAVGGALLLWGLWALGEHPKGEVFQALERSALKTSPIVLFLLSVMMVVEWIQQNGGFDVLQKWLIHDNALQEVWRLTWLTFLLSAIIDNMTATLIMLAIVKGRYLERDRQWTLVSLVVLAANAGGAWSPIGDVTTTMLWIAGKVSAWGLIKGGLVAAILNCLVPLLLCTKTFMAPGLSKGNASPGDELCKGALSRVESAHSPQDAKGLKVSRKGLILSMGLGLMLLIPIGAHFLECSPSLLAFLSVLMVAVFLDPFLGPFLSRMGPRVRPPSLPQSHGGMHHAFFKLDWFSVAFIFGILMCMGVLEEAGILTHLSKWMHAYLGEVFNQVFTLGLLSAFLDNIPLVSASLGLFDSSLYERDHALWLLLAYCAGTGGSLLILGSAAGIVAMGQEGLKFTWYLKHFTLKALGGYLAGALVFWLLG